MLWSIPYTPATLRTGKGLGTQCTGWWVDSRVGMDGLGEEEMSFSDWSSNHGP